MSPVFRHGSLRLYLLKLLDEEPRHGYEIIRLLQDRFLGVYAPSPGTIYPRLARLEEEGLVTHDEIDGRKVYRITERGREELHARTDDLAELEEEITASVRDIAREVSEDVRETVRSLREELASAARDMNRTRAGAAAGHGRDAGQSARDKARRSKGGEGKTDDAWSQASDSGDEAEDAWARTADETGRPRSGRGRGWGDWPGWMGGPDWGGGPGWGGWPGGGGPHGRPSYRNFRDLERLARQFARELRTAAWHAQAVSEDALGDLRVILDETLDRIKTEVFTGTGGPRRPKDSASGPEGGPAASTGAAQGSGPAPDEGPGPGREGPSSGPGGSGPGAGPRPDAEPPADS